MSHVVYVTSIIYLSEKAQVWKSVDKYQIAYIKVSLPSKLVTFCLTEIRFKLISYFTHIQIDVYICVCFCCTFITELQRDTFKYLNKLTQINIYISTPKHTSYFAPAWTCTSCGALVETTLEFIAISKYLHI